MKYVFSKSCLNKISMIECENGGEMKRNGHKSFSKVCVEMNNQDLRGIIIKLQDHLTDEDRQRLHFFLGNDVPRRIRDEPTLSGTLSLMESLFDQDKINEQDFTFLIHAFEQIRCIDAVKLLRGKEILFSRNLFDFLLEHMRRMQSNNVHQQEQSLATIMSYNKDQFNRDDEEDRIALPNSEWKILFLCDAKD